ncbi:MAG: 2Fe-2S iron-sulfur cluster-binding protein [Desulfobacteraceae bacterium]
MTRLNHLPTLRVDLSEKIDFSYRGKPYSGVKGDTIASALYAAGIRIFSRSLKYHRPRGLYSLDGECSNTCMEVDQVPNVRCENTLLTPSMDVREQNVKGSAEHDLMGVMDQLDFLMPAGFYYKTMHKPAALWKPAMKQIRKAAGLGRLKPDFRMKGQYDEIFPSTDVCVIGGGPSGMNAALAAAEKGLRVIILESRPWLGGFFDYRPTLHPEGEALYKRAEDLAGKVTAHPEIRVFTHTAMIGAYNNNLITGFQTGNRSDSFDERYVEIRANSVVVATGAIERPLIFENNERPGVMQISCAHRLARTFGIIPGSQAVFSIGHDLGLEAAVDLFDLGMPVSAVADIREDGQDMELVSALEKRNIKVLKGWVAAKAHGSKKVTGVTLTSLDGTIKERLPCDLVVASAGITPVTGPLTIVQGKLKYDDHTGCFLPDKIPANMHAAGRVTGLNHPRSIERSGVLAGLKAAFDCTRGDVSEIEAAEHELTHLPGPPRGTKLVTAPVKGRKSFICFDEDTTIKNIRQAIDMGFDVPELIKRFTSAGTGPGQGGIPGHNLPLYTAKYQVLKGMDAKPTNVRSPLVPTFIATFAGTNHNMRKLTPMDSMQRREGGIFRRIGVWERARYFSQDFSCRAEIENVRTNVGLFDGSTLGKFRIHGPDALNALQRVYVSDMSKIKPGRVKYSAMCNDDGCVIDDGVVVKIDENDYYITTSTGRAGSTIEWIRFHTRFDGWDFNMVNLTDAMGVINLAGPNSRKVLEKIVCEDVSNEAFGFSRYRELMIRDSIPVRAMRLGFVGELSYELHVPSSCMKAVWCMLKEAGQSFNIKNFGVEAQNVLRMEKGHVILGSESEQRTNLLDIGLGFLWDRTKAEFKTVGAVALHQAKKDEKRLKLIGFKMEEGAPAPKEGALIVEEKIKGYVCTARNSFALNEAVGMALVSADLSKTGTSLAFYEDECNGNLVYGKVVKMPFYDPEGKRMKG